MKASRAGPERSNAGGPRPELRLERNCQSFRNFECSARQARPAPVMASEAAPDPAAASPLLGSTSQKANILSLAATSHANSKSDSEYSNSSSDAENSRAKRSKPSSARKPKSKCTQRRTQNENDQALLSKIQMMGPRSFEEYKKRQVEAYSNQDASGIDGSLRSMKRL